MIITLKNFTSYRTIKFDYRPGKITAYLDGKLISNWICGSEGGCGASNKTTKVDHIPTSPMTLVIGTRVIGGTLEAPINLIWDYVKVTN